MQIKNLVRVRFILQIGESIMVTSLGWTVIVLRKRTEYIEEHKNLDNRYVVVATPSHKSDYDVLDKIFELNLKPKYFGMLCSKKKVGDYLARLKQSHKEELDLSNFYAPIGLQTGGDSPEEVAISIASEILTIYYEKDKINCHMRELANYK